MPQWLGSRSIRLLKSRVERERRWLIVQSASRIRAGNPQALRVEVHGADTCTASEAMMKALQDLPVTSGCYRSGPVSMLHRHCKVMHFDVDRILVNRSCMSLNAAASVHCVLDLRSDRPKGCTAPRAYLNL